MEGVPEQFDFYQVEGVQSNNNNLEWWSADYKLVRQYLYGDDNVQHDLP